MGIEYKQPKMKDSLYGEMLWEDDADWGDWFWFSSVEDEVNGVYEVYIVAESPSEFMAVRNSHSTYKKLIADLQNIRKQTVLELMENEELSFAKKKQKKFAIEKIQKSLKLHSIKIFFDLSATIVFDSEMLLGDSDEFIFSMVEPNGEVVEASVGFY